jgi:hypothetical protein
MFKIDKGETLTELEAMKRLRAETGETNPYTLRAMLKAMAERGEIKRAETLVEVTYQEA